jgi:hypothetical protein
VVLAEYYGNQTGTLLLQIDPETASVVVSAGFRDAGENSDAIPYDFAFDSAGNIVVVGRKFDEYRQIAVTPQTGSGVGRLVILNSATASNAVHPVTNSWYVTGTGITGRTSIQYVNRYTGLTGTVRQGSGAEFTIDKTEGSAGTTFTPSSYGDVLALSVVKDGAGYKYISAQRANWAVPADYDTLEALPNGTVFTVVLAGGTYTFTTTSKGGTTGNDVSWYGEFSPTISGTVFEAPSSITFGNTAGSYSVMVTDQGNNYLAGHKIKVLGSQLGGVDGVNDCIITVDSNTVENGMVVSNAGTPTGTAAQYTAVTGTNYNVGSGASVDVTVGDDGLITINNISAVGSNYVIGDRITVLGTVFAGGTAPANNLIIVIDAVDGSGGFTGYDSGASSGTAPTTYRTIEVSQQVDFGGSGSWSVVHELGGEAFVYKADSEFGYLWSKVLSAGGQYDTERYLSVAIGSDNAIYAAGEMIARNNVAGADLNSYWCAVVSKFASNGTHAWTKALNTTLNDSYAKCVSVQGTNNIVVTHEDNNNGNTIITKLDAAGNVKWQRSTNSGDDSSVAVDTNGDVYAVTEAQFENRYEDCIKLIKFNAAGEIVYRKFFGTLLYDYSGTREFFKNGRNLTLDADNLYVSGYTTAFDDDNDNSFLVKLPKDASCEGSYSGWVLQNDIYDVVKITATEATTFAPVIGTGEWEAWTPDFNTNWFDPSDNDEYHTLAEIVDRDGGAVVFADGTRQTSSAQLIPQRKIFNGADHRLQPEDSGRHILVTNNDTSIIVPYNEDSPLPIGFTVVL